MSEPELFTVRNVAGAVRYTPNVEEIGWEWFASAHPHEAYATWPDRFWAYFQTKSPGKTREEMERLLAETEERVPGSGECASNEARGSTYPNSPGFKREGTSKLAAETFASEDDKLRDQVMKVLSLGDYTSDEIAVRLKRTPFSIRPRVSQLFTQGKIADTGQRRKNESGHQATVWKALD